nr:hypothetical protein [Methylorubrum zatmanii]
MDDTAHQERADGELVYAGMGVVRLIGATLSSGVVGATRSRPDDYPARRR